MKDTGDAPVTVRFSYWLNNAGWKPQYRIKTDADSDRVSIRMDAVITQNSGDDWQDVALTLASSDRLNDVMPPALGSWVINDVYDQNRLLRSARPMTADFAMSAAKAALPAAAQDSAGLTWALGRLDVPASASVTRLVSLHELATTFSRLARPGLSRDVWMCATLTDAAQDSKKLPLLPTGQASFLVDGRETARGPFSFGPGTRDIFFGVDQLMSVSRQELASQDSAQTMTSPDNDIRQWRWKTVVRNGHDRAVTVRVEENAPIARNGQTTIEVSTEPPAVLNADSSRYIWTLGLPAHEERDILYGVTARTPVPEAESGKKP